MVDKGSIIKFNHTVLLIITIVSAFKVFLLNKFLVNQNVTFVVLFPSADIQFT